MSMRAWIASGVSFVTGFVREHTPESSTRLCAILFCIAGCLCAMGTVVFAFVHPAQAGTVTALVGVTSTVIASGCVAIINRTRKGPPPSP
jgi:biotin transporter BioY